MTPPGRPPGTPWRGQGRVPPPPTSPTATVELPVARARGWWARLDPMPKSLLILATAALPLFLCCGGVAVVTAVNREPPPDTATGGSPDPAAAATPSPSASPPPTVVTRIVTETEEIPFEEVEVDDPALLEGTQEVRTAGVAGELTVTYEVTLTDGEQTGRHKVKEEVTREPVDRVTAIGTGRPEPEPAPAPAPAPAPGPEPEPGTGSDCHPSYTGACVPANVSDVDCEGGSGDGPAYVRGPVLVVGPDVYDLDRDGDGVACE